MRSVKGIQGARKDGGEGKESLEERENLKMTVSELTAASPFLPY